MESEEQIEQTNNRPWLYKKGQSGNPKGRPPGTFSMKEYIKKKLAAMTDEEREEFLEGIDKKTIWEMGEGKAEAKTDITSGGEKLTFGIAEAIAKKNDIITETE
jgi:Family of unknown function (DUF5681)